MQCRKEFQGHDELRTTISRMREHHMMKGVQKARGCGSKWKEGQQLGI